MNSFYKIKLLIFLILIFDQSIVFGINTSVEQLKIGNLALPTSQQPGPLIGFGQNIVDKGDFQLFSYVDYLNGCNKNFTEVSPYILYGFTDRLSLFLELPVAVKFQEGNQVARGIQEFLIQFEYALYEKNTVTATNQVTLVSNITLTNDLNLNQLRRGSGATNFFIGFTASRASTQWYPFVCMGARLSPSRSNNKSGNQFLYDFGISKNICSAPDKYILNWMIELDGTYRQKSINSGVIDSNSGGNTLLFGPSIWFSTQKFILQAGVSAVIFEKLYGNQNKNKYYVAIDLGWKF